ncbi:MerR family DNA-binding transcriptional regulator [Paenibacillus sp. S-38]
MKISALAEKTGVSVRCLRHYEQKGLIHSTRLENRYRGL